MSLKKVVEKLTSAGYVVKNNTRHNNFITVSIVPNYDGPYYDNNFILLRFGDTEINICMVESQYGRERDRIACVSSTGHLPMFSRFACLSGDANNIYINRLVNSVQIYQIDNNMQKVLKTILSVMSDSQMQEMMDNFAVCSKALASCFSELREEIAKLRGQIEILDTTNREQENTIQKLNYEIASLKGNSVLPTMEPASLDHDDE